MRLRLHARPWALSLALHAAAGATAVWQAQGSGPPVAAPAGLALTALPPAAHWAEQVEPPPPEPLEPLRLPEPPVVPRPPEPEPPLPEPLAPEPPLRADPVEHAEPPLTFEAWADPALARRRVRTPARPAEPPRAPPPPPPPAAPRATAPDPPPRPVPLQASAEVVGAVPWAGNLPPRYPPEALRLGLEGLVLLELGLSAEGTVSWVRVLASSGHALLDAEAARAASAWRYRPARRDGRPVPSTLRQPVRFTRR